jgi:hypothetical protein
MVNPTSKGGGREYLTVAEVDRLMAAAKGNRYGPATPRWPWWPTGTAYERLRYRCGPRYFHLRNLPLGGRLGVTVRFTVAGVTSLRWALAMIFALCRGSTVRKTTVLAAVSTADCNALATVPLTSDDGAPLAEQNANAAN